MKNDVAEQSAVVQSPKKSPLDKLIHQAVRGTPRVSGAALKKLATTDISYERAMAAVMKLTDPNRTDVRVSKKRCGFFLMRALNMCETFDQVERLMKVWPTSGRYLDGRRRLIRLAIELASHEELVRFARNHWHK